MIMERDRQTLLTIVGITAGVATGVAAGVWLWRRKSAQEPAVVGGWGLARGSAQDVSDSLSNDPKLSRRRIEVDAIAEGVVELSGMVRDRNEAERAVGLAQGTTGVYTVVNRLRIEAEEARRETTRQRWNDGAPDLRERQHYGMGVGMGTPRHASRTDPDRPNDKQRIIERELDVAKVEDEPGPAPGTEATGSVEDSTMKPGDERAIREAGLDPTPGGTAAAQGADVVDAGGDNGEPEEAGGGERT